ncbi:Oligopeptide transport ATP-binding protein AppD [Caldibacillus thermoamylovorans]|jgi:oligopeptide/dipeptide ABC transporter ATP-binding protein|uniref:Oligopeptide transport ATP-binding protein AppD n=1 Tax=Caldibacillus thermoamylovorans TaxID=35841 RepID=A0A090J352_9BACI|nr:ABC transporter ATP-binding protein [Caldibacillus thermoamylovorans]MCM3476790.1 ABC transporter ATP-binding protein [Caldibacillus thermoamylovorans]CEE03108.1 Oligopeptide transport ATP-binding protein AppD [Caldibacillus thermoamylovorans]
MNHLLQVENMKVEFRTAKGPLTAVRSISFHVDKGETLCIVGESGCGKSITSLSIMGLLPQNGNIVEGSIKLENDKLVGLTDEQLQSYRGNKISMIFQEPMTALNPVFTIGYQLQEPLLIHKKISKKEAKQASIELLRKVGIPNPEEKINQYPHQLSGGMRQRVMIAMALACEPLLLIADEPTTALDVTIQAQILDLIEELKEQMGMGVIFVTHDMGVVAEIADRVMVMYAGEVVEMSDAQTIFANPKHPYTQGLLAAVPDVEADAHELNVIPGSMPNLDEKIEGCRFHPRCPFATDICRQKNPPTFKISENQEVKCWLQEAKMHIESAATS